MRLRFVPIPTLPRLSWCARFSRGDETVEVEHGPWVETRAGAFVAGAWDGDFKADDFDRAACFMGSGARLEGSEVLFVASTDPFTSLYSLRTADTLRISNSLAFLLVRSGKQPDINYPHYYHDLLHAVRWGYRKRERWLPLAEGYRVGLHFGCNLRLLEDLSLRRTEKVIPPPFEDFEGFRDASIEILRRVFGNAGDPSRKQGYAPLATISRGYDSTAVSALAAQAGCTEAVTFRSPPARGFFHDDDGSEIGERLGLTVHRYDHADQALIGGLHEAEFAAAGPAPNGQALALVENRLPGRLLLTAPTDGIWGMEPHLHLPDVMLPTKTRITEEQFAEFSLRVGVLHFPVTHIHALRREKLLEIAGSKAMKSWSVGGDYDRPVARRIVEERGVPRDLFARRKQAGAYVRPVLDTLHPGSREDFLGFLGSRGLRDRNHRTPFSLRDWLLTPLALLYHLLILLPDKRLFKKLVPLLLLSDRRVIDPRRDPYFQYSLHWGFDRIKSRYEIT